MQRSSTVLPPSAQRVPGPAVDDADERPDWYRLDNAARVFAALISRRTTTVFRVAVVLNAAVDRELVEEALAAIMPRFPTFAVRLRRGLFWHSLVRIDGTPPVQVEQHAPCGHLNRRTDGPWCLRVLVYKRRLAVEVSHVLTDGSGAVAFLQALLAEYLTLSGVIARPEVGLVADGPPSTPADAGVSTTAAAAAAAAAATAPLAPRILRPGDQPDPEETEDAYRRFYDPSIPSPPAGPRAARLRGRRVPPAELRVTLGIIPFAPVRALATAHGVTITEILVSVLLDALQEVLPRARRPLAVMTPVDLRRIFASRTLRNFFLSLTASIDPRLGRYALDEILHDVHHSMQGQVTARAIARQIHRNVGAERNWFIRHIPLFIKVAAKRTLYRRRWGARFTTVLSNLGNITLPPELDAHVERFEFVPNPSEAHGLGVSVVGHRGKLFIAFAGTQIETGLERAFFTRLRALDVVARIETN